MLLRNKQSLLSYHRSDDGVQAQLHVVAFMLTLDKTRRKKYRLKYMQSILEKQRKQITK